MKIKTYGWVLATLTLEVIAGMTCVANRAHAQSNDYSFAWLDPDKKIYVLQNRKYTKAGRPELSMAGGLGLSNPFRNTSVIDARATYYFTEDMGLELLYIYSFQTSSSTFDLLKQTVPTTLPVAREFRAQYAALFKWIPWYAKINVFNSILYFDWHFGAGLGQVTYDTDLNTNANNPPNFYTQTTMGYYLQTGHAYHLNQNWDVKLNLLGVFYQSPQLGNTGPVLLYSNFMVTAGVGYRF